MLNQLRNSPPIPDPPRANDIIPLHLFDTVRALVGQRNGGTAKLSLRQLALRTEDYGVDVTRSQNVTVATAGGFTTASEVRDFQDQLRPHSVVIEAGAQVVTVARDQSTSEITGGATGQWLSETGEVQEGSMTFGNLSLKPRRVSALLKVSKQLLSQSPALAEMVILRNMHRAIGQALDTGALSGLGGVEPPGLCLNDDIPHAVTFGAAATLAKICDIEQALADAFGENGSPTFICSTATRSKLRQKEAITGGGKPIWTSENTIVGKPALASPSIAGGIMLLGNFADLLICLFGDAEIISDPYASKKTGQHEFVINLRADCGPVRRNSFQRSADSAAQ